MPKRQDFSGRIQQLLDQVGDYHLRGEVKVNQVYARYQHERLDLKHPTGGGAKYLTLAFMGTRNTALQRLANAVLDGDVRAAMIANVEDVSYAVSELAPFEFGDLGASGHPQVRDQGRYVYNRQPLRARLTHEELRIKSRLRSLGFGNGD